MLHGQTSIKCDVNSFVIYFFLILTSFLYTLCRCRRLLLHLTTLSDTHARARAQAVGILWTSDQPEAETSACKTHTTYTRLTSMPPAGFEPAIPASEKPQIHALYTARRPLNISVNKGHGLTPICWAYKVDWWLNVTTQGCITYKAALCCHS